MLPLVNEPYLTLKPYVPGKPVSETERELGISGCVKLASNENPLGPSPKAVEAVRAASSRMTCSRCRLTKPTSSGDTSPRATYQCSQGSPPKREKTWVRKLLCSVRPAASPPPAMRQGLPTYCWPCSTSQLSYISLTTARR